MESLKHRPELELTASAKPVNLAFTHLRELPIQKRHHETTEIVGGLFLLLLDAVFFHKLGLL